MIKPPRLRFAAHPPLLIHIQGGEPGVAQSAGVVLIKKIPFLR